MESYRSSARKQIQNRFMMFLQTNEVLLGSRNKLLKNQIQELLCVAGLYFLDKSCSG
jgi:hypothetical protein